METNLIEAVKGKHSDAVARLLGGGADLEQQDDHGWTALCWAAGGGPVDLVRSLLESGADPAHVGRDHRTPLMIARAAGRLDEAKLLEEAERRAGCFQNPREMQPYCRAYYLHDVLLFAGWTELTGGEGPSRLASESASTPSLAPDESAGERAEDQAVVYLHDDFTLTRSIWRGEDVIVAKATPAWREFCQNELEFTIPEDLR